MQQIKLKGFSSWGGKNAQHCRYSTHVAEMLQKKLHGFFFPVMESPKEKGSTKKTLSRVEELSRAKRASRAPWVRKCNDPPIRENLVIT